MTAEDRRITLYRLHRGVRGPQATEQDFLSNRRKGKKPRHTEITNPAEHDAVSFWDTREKVEHWARQFPEAVGRYVAELHIPADAPLRLAQEGDPGHWNAYDYGEPAAFLPYVQAVHAVRPATDE
jgi:hypothetical protein